MLNALYDYIKELDLNVNVSKTNVYFFLNGGEISDHEKWEYNEQHLKVTKKYTLKYLSMLFNLTGKNFQAQKMLLTKVLRQFLQYILR